MKQVRFENPRLAALGIESMTLGDLRKKVRNTDISAPERVAFYFLMLVTSGQSVHTVDFRDWALSKGALLFLRPGQVQQWHMNDGLSAQLVVIDPACLPIDVERTGSNEGKLLDLFEWQPCVQLSAGLFEQAKESFLRLHSDFERFDNSELDTILIRHELLALLLRLARWQRELAVGSLSQRKGRETYRLFIKALEAHFEIEHSLCFYAKRLGYAQSTLSRACLAAEGRTAKAVIDQRVSLEAQRRLVHSASSISEIAHQLSFSETTNFVRFFRRIVGVTPAQFRKKHLA